MNKNLGNSDRLTRVLIAFVLVALYATNLISGTVGWVALAIAGLLVLTSIISFCPLYRILGIKTCSSREGAGKLQSS